MTASSGIASTFAAALLVFSVAADAGGLCRSVPASSCEDPTPKEDIFVTPGALGTLPVRYLERAGHYLLRRPPDHPVHWIVTPADLRHPAIATRLRKAFEGGYTVAVTDAGERVARQLAQVLGATSWISPGEDSLPGRSMGWGRSGASELGALTLLRHYASAREGGEGTGDKHHAVFTSANGRPWQDERTIAWLSDHFGRERHRIEAPGVTTEDICADPSCVTKTATPKTFCAYHTDGAGNSVSVSNEFYAARSFSQQYDYYFVAMSTDYTAGPTARNDWTFDDQFTNTPTPNAIVVGATPASSVCTGTITTTSSHSMGQSVGLSGASGSAVLTVGASYGTQKGETCDQWTIVNAADFAGSPSAGWTRGTTQTINSTTQSISNQAIWMVPFSDEPTSGEISFRTRSCQFWNQDQGSLCASLTATSQTVDFPFPTQTPVAPSLDAVTPSSVRAGALVIASGSAFYPSTVIAVTVGGFAVPQANMDLEKSTATAIQFSMPGTVERNTPLPVVVHTYYGLTSESHTVTVTD